MGGAAGAGKVSVPGAVEFDADVAAAAGAAALGDAAGAGAAVFTGFAGAAGFAGADCLLTSLTAGFGRGATCALASRLLAGATAVAGTDF